MGKFSCEMFLGGAGSRVPPATRGVVIFKHPGSNFLGLFVEGGQGGGFFGPKILGGLVWGPNVGVGCSM